MPTLKINGQEVEVPAGTTVFQACQKLGMKLPHYCYHPALPIAGNCRICMVEIGGRPMTSCSTLCADNMEVFTDTPLVQEARKAVMEFLLLNHPLDCPVCDQAGDCQLQNFYLEYARHKSRMPLEQKVHKAKRKAIMEHVMLDQERCILCSRCVRFCSEITRTYELGIFQRGDQAFLDVVPDSLPENNYTGNLVDICPVGALTDRNFRYSLPSWFLKRTPSLCPHCERGCNIELHTEEQNFSRRHRRAYRILPRFNEEVNGYWICDTGRYSYKEIDENRLEHFLFEGALAENLSWEEVLLKLVAFIKEKRGKVLLNTFLTNEELFLAKHLFEKAGWETGCATFEDPDFEDALLRKKNRSPNLKMAQELTLPLVHPEAFLADAERAFVFHPERYRELPVPEKTVFFASHDSPYLKQGWLVLPVAVYAEKRGSFTNFQGKIQFFEKALEPLGKGKSEEEILRELTLLLEFPLEDFPFSFPQTRASFISP